MLPLRPLVRALLALSVMALVATPVLAQPAPPAPVSMVDSRGHQVTVGDVPRRIVSLAPSTTEIACAVGACDRVVAVDALSDYPPEVQALPRLNGPRIGAESVLAQEPDLVLAASITSVDLLDRLEALGVPVVVADATSFDDLDTAVRTVGRAVGSPDQGDALAVSMQARVAEVAARTAGVEQRPTVFHELDDHLFSATRSTFIGAIIDLAGGQNIVASAAMVFPQVSAEYVITANPDVIVLADAGFGTTVESVGQRPGWSSVHAVQTGRVYPINGDLVSRPGPRLVDGLEAYARLLHPEVFPPDPPAE